MDIYYILLPILMIMSGLMAGSSLAILGLDTSDLELKSKLGNKRAEKLLPLRKQGNRVLSTINITNVAVNSALTLLLGKILPGGLIAGLVSTVLIVIFGEIIPQAICNKNKLVIGSAVSPFIKLLMILTYPITKPISWILNKWVGTELPVMYTPSELNELITSNHHIDSDEKNIALGSLSFSNKIAIDVMTPVTQVYCLDLNDQVSISEIKNETWSRIPVYEKNRDNIIGIVYSKELLGETGIIDVSKYLRPNVIRIKETTTLDEVLNEMTKRNNHMSFVYDEFGALRGIVTFEDIMEAIIKREIIDEHDNIADLQEEARKEFEHKLI